MASPSSALCFFFRLICRLGVVGQGSALSRLLCHDDVGPAPAIARTFGDPSGRAHAVITTKYRMDLSRCVVRRVPVGNDRSSPDRIEVDSRHAINWRIGVPDISMYLMIDDSQQKEVPAWRFVSKRHSESAQESRRMPRPLRTASSVILEGRRRK